MTTALTVAVPHSMFSYTRIQPVALCYLSAHSAAAGHEVHLLDLNTYDNAMSGLMNHLRQHRYDVIGLSFFNQLPAIRSPIRSIQTWSCAARKFHSGKLVAGGPSFSLVANQAIREIPELDLGILGDGEPGFTALLEGRDASEIPGAVFRDSHGELHANPRASFDMRDLPPAAAMPGLVLDNYDVIGVQTKRGCAHACSFCPGPYLRGRGPRQRPMETVLQEIEGYFERGQRRFLFVDPVFNEPPDECKAFLRHIRDRHISIEWWGLLRPEFVDAEFVELAESTGCFMLEISADFGTEAGLKKIGTGKTLTDVTHALSLIHENSKIRTLTYFLFGYPGISFWENWKSFLFVGRMIRNSNSQAEFFLSPFKPYPHTPIAVKMGKSAHSFFTRLIHTFTDVHILLFIVLAFQRLAKSIGDKLAKRSFRHRKKARNKSVTQESRRA